MRFNTLAAVILLISGCGYGGLELESFPEVSQKPAKEAKLKPESPQRKRPDRDDQRAQQRRDTRVREMFAEH